MYKIGRIGTTTKKSVKKNNVLSKALCLYKKDLWKSENAINLNVKWGGFGGIR